MLTVALFLLTFQIQSLTYQYNATKESETAIANSGIVVKHLQMDIASLHDELWLLQKRLPRGGSDGEDVTEACESRCFAACKTTDCIGDTWNQRNLVSKCGERCYSGQVN